MRWDETYRQWRRDRTAYPGQGSFLGVVYSGLGVANEGGEVAGEVKKAWRDDKGFVSSRRREKILKEMGDTLWYLDALADELGTTLEYVAVLNIKKILDRDKEKREREFHHQG